MSRVNIATVMIRADRRWCVDNCADATHPEHMAALVRAVETHVGTAAVDELRLEVAKLRSLLGKLLREVSGEWQANGNQAEQTTAAVGQVRAVREYLKSLHTAEKGAA